MNKINKERDIKRRNRFLLFISLFITSLVISQEISSHLDSINNLPGKDINKLDVFNNLFKKHEEKQNFSQLGNDAHQLAKWLYKDDIEKAIFYTQVAIDARQKATDPFDPCFLKSSFYNLGFFNQRKGNLTKAIEAYKKAIAIKESNRLNDKSYSNIAKLYYVLGDNFLAAENYEKSFYFLDSKNIKSRINNHIGAAHSYKNQRSIESGKKAIYHLLIADSLVKQNPNPDPNDIYSIYNNIAGQYYQNVDQEIEKALFYYNKALIEAKKINNEAYLQQVYYNLGLAYIDIDTNTAENLFLKSLEYKQNEKRLEKSIFLGLGLNAFTEKKYSIAQEFYQKSLSLFFKKEIIDPNWVPTKEELKNVDNKSLLLELYKRQIQNLIVYGNSNNNKNLYLLAIRTAKNADLLTDLLLLENLSVQSKLLWRDLASEIYILGLEACYLTNNIEDAFYFMEKNKAILLIQEFSKNTTSIPEDILERELKIKQSIEAIQNENTLDNNNAILTQKLVTEQLRLETFQDSLSHIYPGYFSNLKLPETIAFNDIKIESDEFILHYTMAERIAGLVPNAYGLAISNHTKLLFKIEHVDVLLQNIKQFRNKLNQPFKNQQDISSYNDIAYQLYAQLIPEDLRKELKNKKVTIITDHLISFIPFDALITKKNTNNYLIEDCEIKYEYSLSFQKQNTRLRRSAKQSFLGIAPTHFFNDLTTLNNSSNEIKFANDLYQGDLLLETNATKDNFIKAIQNYKILHLATHANASDSIAPWIAFRNSKLTDQELNTLKTQAELVVLSACNTSLGEVMRGEGIMSLARGFFKSGANTVISSLWSTNDKTTTTITSDFYKNLSEGQTKSEALRTAKLTYLKNNTDAEASPHYWASLILIGDSGLLLPEGNNLSFLWIGIGILLLFIFLFLFFNKKRK